MISISHLLCDNATFGDRLRYDQSSAQDDPRPVVVWNCTRQCNLSCRHCYALADNKKSAQEMDTASGRKFIADLAEYGVPVLLFSGGEPLLRPDIFELAGLARELGLRGVLSTNGTLITQDVATTLHNIGFAEIGISLDGVGASNDCFRGQEGAYRDALAGIRTCINAGLRVSLRLTIARHNYRQIPDIFRLVEAEGIDRLCFYHLAYSGRGSNLKEEDISHAQTRAVVDSICEHTLDLHRRGQPKEVLTVDNHADGVYLYLKLREEDPQRAKHVRELLQRNGGNNSGIRIAAVDDVGNVHPDQFWWHYALGNVKQRRFSDIWRDTSDPLLRDLRRRQRLLKGRCAHCQYLELCNGNLRVRAEAVWGDVWAEDPACYLTDKEIGLK